jgi:hypothetical protein
MTGDRLLLRPRIQSPPPRINTERESFANDHLPGLISRSKLIVLPRQILTWNLRRASNVLCCIFTANLISNMVALSASQQPHTNEEPTDEKEIHSSQK